MMREGSPARPAPHKKSPAEAGLRFLQGGCPARERTPDICDHARKRGRMM
jgi:hypothetical protein